MSLAHYQDAIRRLNVNKSGGRPSPHKLCVLLAVLGRYEYRLRQALPLVAKEGPAPACVRDPAFRRVVTEVYDYRCAATGVRILLSTGEAMVEAGDDDPRNGLARQPGFG